MATDPTPVVRTLSGGPYRALEEFFEKNGPKPQVFKINPLRRTTIVGEKGLRITFFPYALCNVFGEPVEDKVDVRLIEIGSRSDMILAGKVTTSDDSLLESGGVFQLQAMQDFLPLELRRPLMVELPVAREVRNPVAVRLYAGSTATTRPFSGERAFDWRLLDPHPLRVRKLGERKYFTFEVSEFNWFSCNYPSGRRGNRTMVSMQTSCSAGEIDHQIAWLAFRDANAVARMFPAGNRFTIFNIPKHAAASVLAIGLHQGQLFFGQTDIESTAGQLVQVALHPVREWDLREAIR
jgi:hypothetical protein